MSSTCGSQCNGRERSSPPIPPTAAPGIACKRKDLACRVFVPESRHAYTPLSRQAGGMGRIRNTVVAAGCALAIIVVGILDWGTGIELRVFPLYFIPIAVGVQVGGPAVRYGLTALATVTWAVAYSLDAGEISLLTGIWNVAAQMAAFSLVAYLVGRQWDQRKQEEARSREDYLTGLQNSRAFFETLAREIERANRYHRALALAYMDMDDFKNINDSRGHQTGDEVLKTLARILRSGLRSTDVVARLGGDEFAILLIETDRASAETVLRKVQAEVNAGLAARFGTATVSIGAAICESFVPPPSEFVRRADSLMYEVKRAGKNACLVRAV